MYQFIYKKIISDVNTTQDTSLTEHAQNAIPANFIKIILSLFLTKIGDALINPKVTLPWILQTLGAPAYLIGWLVPLRESGSLLPQLAVANYMKQLSIRKWVWVCGSLLQGMAMLSIAWITFHLEGAAAGWTILLFLAIFSLSRGLTSVASKDILGKTIPKSQRGQVNGLSTSGAGFITLVLAAIMTLSSWLNWQASTEFYGYCILASGGVWFLAAALFSKISECPGEVEPRDKSLTSIFQPLILLKDDHHFRRFVLTRTLFLSTALSAPYYVVFAQQEQGGSITLLALFMFASGLASFLSGPFWGRFSDRSSRQVMLISASMSAVIGIVFFLSDTFFSSLLSSSVWCLPLLYFLVCIAHDGVRVGRKTYLVDMTEGNKRTSYVAVSNTVIGAMLLLVSLLGALVTLLGMSGLVFLFSCMTLLGVRMARSLPDVTHH